MAGFLYFVEGAKRTPGHPPVARLGLSYALSPAPTYGLLDDNRTPSGKPGMLLADPARLGGRELIYDRQQQTWRKRPGSAGIWVGMWNKSRPTPEDLARDRQLAGDRVEIVPGQIWEAPWLLFWAEDDGFIPCLPAMAELTDSGEWSEGEVESDYRHLVALSERLYEAMVKAPQGEAPHLTSIEALDAAVTLLNINYVVDRLELVMMGALPIDYERLRPIISAAMTWDRVKVWIQKKNAETSQPIATG